jgi:hypothetical protein
MKYRSDTSSPQALGRRQQLRFARWRVGWADISRCVSTDYLERFMRAGWSGSHSDTFLGPKLSGNDNFNPAGSVTARPLV